MRLISLVVVSLLLAGCGGDDFQDLRDFVKNTGEGMRGKIPPPPEVKPYEPFVYNNEANLPDPFKPRKPELQPGGRAGVNQPDFNRPKEDLEAFPLESLKMTGYLYRNKIGYAVIRDPNGNVHTVKAGNYLGQNFGRIQKVDETEVIIREMVQDSNGDWSERMSSLQLLE